jgi:hypothetical protein
MPTSQRSAGVGTPVRGEQAGERGDEIHSTVVIDRVGEFFHFSGGVDQAEVVTPLDEGSGDAIDPSRA